MEEAKQRVKQAGYAGTELEAYITYIKRFDKAAGINRFNPYMTVDGRVKEATKANDTFQIFTYFNTGTEDTRISIGDSFGEIVVPARSCVAMFYDNSGHIHMGTASIGTEGMVDRTNPLENAETSAVGRALGLAGYGLIPGAGIASAEEMGEAFSRQQTGDQAVTPSDLDSYTIHPGGWGKDNKFGGMSLEEVYEDPDGYGAMSWAATLDAPRSATAKMAQYFKMREQEEKGGVPDGTSLEAYDESVSVPQPISRAEAKSINELIQANVGEGKLFGHAKHARNHLKSHFNVAKVMDLTGDKAAALVRYIQTGGKDADPRWYAEVPVPTVVEPATFPSGEAIAKPMDELFGPESVEDLLKKAAPNLPEAWRDEPEKWWGDLCKQYSIGPLNAKQLETVRALLGAVASGNMSLEDQGSATYKVFTNGMAQVANDA